ncbi:MAG TPA: N-acetylglucosamine-6-phosphate deacetylase, partial [Blastocatellia bacterium]|nr:N-acetylglucosamine-6-phosphate deacetylase [Blastocatellia bacterium]
MTRTLIKNARLVLPTGIHAGGVLIDDTHISHVFGSADTPTGFTAPDTIDAAGNHLSPGFVDIHLHGSA